MPARRLVLVLTLVLAAHASVTRAATWSWWPWSKPGPAPARAAEPSMWNKMNAGTKRFFAKTKDVLTPDKPPSPHRSASHTTRKAPSQRTKQAKKGWINTWFEPKEPQGPQTVNEFLKQPRPEF